MLNLDPIGNPHGVEVRNDGSIRFRLWASAVDRVAIDMEGENGPLALASLGEGWHELVTDRASVGSRYRFVLPDGMRVPDPASRFQPEDVHKASEVVDPASWSWGDAGWLGRPWREAVIYELHIGTFTPEGTFRGAILKLDHLLSLGITAIELMPVSDFPGRRNWGYDGVYAYAPDSTYGRPEDLKAFVEAAHARGLMVLLDVVYSHFGPEGNYLPRYARHFFTDRYKTPWGAAVNFDGAHSRAVREFVIHNAIYWLKHFHLDGLRLDAVHAIVDKSPKHILVELAERVRAAVKDRHIHLVLENEENQTCLLGAGVYTAQWNDDVHHVLHTAATAESGGYYSEYTGDTRKLGRALAEGFVFQGEMMAWRGKPRGQPSRHLPPEAFIAFLQNHDQVGNRAFGDRIGAGISPEILRAVAACYLLLPQIPMLFMGEEWNASQPFPFFCDFGPDLAEAVRKGRREEFARFPEFQDAAQRERIPDPQADSTFESARLCWGEARRGAHIACLEWYRRIISARTERIVPLLDRIDHGGDFEIVGLSAVLVRWRAQPGEQLVLAANLSAVPVSGFPPSSAPPIWKEGDAWHERGSMDSSRTLLPWSVVWSVEARS